MASLTCIEYNDNRFWLIENFIEILSQYICKSFESTGVDNVSENLRDLYGQCDNNRLGNNTGMVGLSLDDYVQNEDKNTLIIILQQAKKLVLAEGELLTLSLLNSWEEEKSSEYFKTEWTIPIKTSSIATTFDYIIQVLNNSLDPDNIIIFYDGYPAPDGVTGI
jgi:hypothetical protein